MEYTIRFFPYVSSRMTAWGLSDNVLIDLRLALARELAADPMTFLVRDPEGRGGIYVVRIVDPDSPAFDHYFSFRVLFDEDEQHLNLVRVSYYRNLRA